MGHIPKKGRCNTGNSLDQKFVVDHWPSLKAPGASLLFFSYNMDDLDECFETGYLPQICAILRSRQVNPNLPINAYTRPPWERFFIDLSKGFYDDFMANVPETVRTFLECRGDPNLSFQMIEITGKGRYQSPTCVHIAYLYWRALKQEGKDREAKWMKQAFHYLLADPRVDVRARFTEDLLTDQDFGHFSYDGAIQGEHLEKATLAHIALAEGDWRTCRKVISMAHDLVAQAV